MPTLRDIVYENVREGELYEKLDRNRVRWFHKDYKMTDPDNTRAKTLMRAAEIGRKSGLRYIYAGNMPGEVGDLENTRCLNCRQLLIKRYGYLITGYHLTSNGDPKPENCDRGN